MSDITFTPVKKSDTLEGVAFFPAYNDMVVKFKKGGVYVYRGADETLAKHLVSTPHPWSKFGSVVKSLPYERLSSGLRTEPLKRKRAAAKTVVTEAPEPKVVVAAGDKAEAKQAPRTRATVKATAPEVEAPKRSRGRPRKDGTPAQPRVVVNGKKVRTEIAPEPEAPKVTATKRTRKPAAAKPAPTPAFSDAK